MQRPGRSARRSRRSQRQRRGRRTRRDRPTPADAHGCPHDSPGTVLCPARHGSPTPSAGTTLDRSRTDPPADVRRGLGVEVSPCSGLVSGGLHPTRDPPGGWGRGRFTGGAGEGSFEPGEQVDDVGCFEDSVALPADVALTEDAGGLETVNGFAGAHLGSADQSCGAVDGDHRNTGQEVEQQFDRRVRSDPAESFPPSCIERFDSCRVGLGVVAGSVCGGGECAQPGAGHAPRVGTGVCETIALRSPLVDKALNARRCGRPADVLSGG